MRRIVLTVASALVVLLTVGPSAGAAGRSTPGFLVVRNAAGDGGSQGHPVVTVVVKGFVVGRVSQEARVDIYHLPSSAGEGAPQAAGLDVSKSGVRWRSFAGTEYSGSGFRFSAIDGAYRVVVRGAGVYLFAGGHGSVTLHGSSVYPGGDGAYALDGRPFRSLPPRALRRSFGGS